MGGLRAWALMDLAANLRMGGLRAWALMDLAANLRMGGLRRDGYGVR